MNNNVLAIYNILSGEAPEPPKPEPGTHAITVISSGEGYAYASVSYAAPGDIITLTADPEDKFISWNVLSGNVTIDVNNQFIMPELDVTIEAIFSGAYRQSYPLWLFYQWDRLRRIERK